MPLPPAQPERLRTFGPRPAPPDLGPLLDFLNTAERRVRYQGKLRIHADRLSSREALERWLTDRGLLVTGVELSAEDRRQTLALRDALRELVETGRPDEPAAIELLQPFAAAARLRIRLAEAGPPRLEPVEDGVAGAFAGWLWLFVVARRDGRWRRVKLCDACQRIFYDRSRTCIAKWCSTVCGDRLRARRRKPKQRASVSAPDP